MEVRRWRRQVQEEDESSAEKKACFFFFFLEGGVIHVVGDRLNRNRKEKKNIYIYIRTQMAVMKLIEKMLNEIFINDFS